MSARVSLCGAGMIAGVHALACESAAATLTHVASRRIDRAETLAGRFGARAVPFEQVHLDADVVIVCTPPALHAPHAVAALGAGATVLVEKPLTRTLLEADALAELASGGTRVVYAENLLFAPAVREFLARLPRLGKLTHLSARSLQGQPTWGGFLEPDWGGGAVFDLGIHPLALAVVSARVAGAGRPVAVTAELRGDRTDTWGRVEIEFEDESRAVVEAGWEGPDDGIWDLQAASAIGTLRLELRPMIALESNGDPVRLPVAQHGIPLIEDFGYVSQLRHAVDPSGDAPPVPMDAEFGRSMMELVTACYASAGARERIDLPFRGDRSSSPLDHWKSAT